MWKPKQRLEIIDVGHGFYVVKFRDHDDMVNVLTHGPYRVVENYVMMKQWEPNFILGEAVMNSLITLLRFSGVPLEFYKNEALFTMARTIGIPIRIDRQTVEAARGRFARVCVQVDLSRPLEPTVGWNGVWYNVEYEGIPHICVRCGYAGHRALECPRFPVEVSDVSDVDKAHVVSVEKEEKLSLNGFGGGGGGCKLPLVVPNDVVVGFER
ncbi:hypothetical protein LINGRAHAP2_LOCUS23237 [Linum grandiflorum]